ncbi:hypothetical protein FB567DRAFT_315259 [Paraphoma chrysanthemicola]|uniref:Uncharacterized protein n=1 Tax=Paraphoma chrysanthemicola TaxID=798071 RepID=A0A8K0W123_9PLEO|nr:hypothetical protein FB567DRAFT_315259 [Paraphoma chrysanthemicola]
MNSTTEIVGWAPEPRARGTISLLWSCFATTFLCTWNAIHPNLPGLREGKRTIIIRRLRYVFTCLLLPEYYALTALSHLANAMLVEKEAKAAAPNSRWSLKQSFFLLMGGFVFQDDFDGAPRYRYNTYMLMRLLKSQQLPWPKSSDEEIDDRSKADWIMKSLALLQIVWFTTQVTGRWVQGLAVTTLELFTFSIVICGIVTYMASWKKPFDVQVPVATRVRYVPFADNNRTTLNDSYISQGVDWLVWSAFIVCLVSGSIQISGWNFHFPSKTEQLLWRISSVACAVLPLLYFTLCLMRSLSTFEEKVAKKVFLSLYTLFRIYMFVEMFVSLRAAPTSVYQTPQWSQYFPSFS